MQLSLNDMVRPPIKVERTPSTWTAARVVLLKDLRVVQKLSAKQIATELGGVSRSAVIGKCHRLGLPSPPAPPRSPYRPRAKLPAQERIARQQASRTKYTERKRLENGSLPPLVIEEAPMPADFLNLTFDELRPFSQRSPNNCRYVRGDDAEKRFCGQPTPAGQAYCGDCGRICYKQAAA